MRFIFFLVIGWWFSAFMALAIWVGGILGLDWPQRGAAQYDRIHSLGEINYRDHPPQFLFRAKEPRRSALLRFLFFISIGWWLGLLVTALAWALGLTWVGLGQSRWLLSRMRIWVSLKE